MARLFISYSHQDEPWKDRVARHLAVLAGEGLATWDDRQLAAGAGWQDEIGQAITDCDCALLLVSVNFLTSRFILGEEVPRLLQRRQAEGTRVIPVILSPCQWQRIGWLKSIQARPRDGRPLSGMSEHEAELALSTLAGEVADLLAAPPAAASFPPTPRPASGPAVMTAKAAPAPGRSSGAAAIWAEKLDYLREQEAICADPAQGFALKKQIEEAERRLRQLS